MGNMDMQGEDMRGSQTRESGDGEALVRELERKLDWYIMEASEEEYDEKAVEYILYLLDRPQPSDEGTLPQADEAWQRFRTLVEQKHGNVVLRGSYKNDGSTPVENRDLQTAAAQKSRGWVAGFLLCHKITAAAVLIILVLAIGGTVRTIARPDTGFFQWLSQDITGGRMLTSPESLDGKTGLTKDVYYCMDDVPGWAQEWLKIEGEMEVSENYEWQRYETNISEGIYSVSSCYLSKDTEEGLIFGMEIFLEKISFNSGRFDEYSYVDDYEADGKKMDIYSRTEDSGQICYIIYFIRDNCQYYILGQENLQELEKMAGLYWDCVENNM